MFKARTALKRFLDVDYGYIKETAKRSASKALKDVDQLLKNQRSASLPI
jgi:hypothetical protein